MKTNIPIDKSQSLSMLRALGLMLANGARADARESRERARRQLERAAVSGDSSRSNSERREPADR